MALALLAIGVWLYWHGRLEVRSWFGATGSSTLRQRTEQYGPAARERLGPSFAAANVPYPPAGLVLVGIKDRKVLELWARASAGQFQCVRSYPILAASGHAGPKLREGDCQVPEGFYRIESLNPNSHYHLALRVNYPNDFDRQRAKDDGRTNLGGDIMIHGGNGSVGCLAMGDQAAEDLFILVADTGLKNTELILSPTDLRAPQAPPDLSGLPPWTAGLYRDIARRLAQLHGE